MSLFTSFSWFFCDIFLDFCSFSRFLRFIVYFLFGASKRIHLASRAITAFSAEWLLAPVRRLPFLILRRKADTGAKPVLNGINKVLVIVLHVHRKVLVKEK